MRREYIIITLVIAFILLLLSAIVHTVSFLGFDMLEDYPIFWLLHFFIFIILIPLMILHKKETGERFGTIKHNFVIKYAPEWMKMFCTALFVYAVINFGLCLVLLEGASPEIWDGRYVLQNKGTFIKELTQDEYQRKKMYEARLFSGHWLVFYFYPITGYCSYLLKQEGEDGDECCNLE